MSLIFFLLLDLGFGEAFYCVFNPIHFSIFSRTPISLLNFFFTKDDVFLINYQFSYPDLKLISLFHLSLCLYLF